MQFNQDDSGREPLIPIVFSRADGDVEIAWMCGAEQTELRRFRSHLGHVVEVLGPEQRLRRTGPGLRGTGSLRVDAALPVVLERALMAMDDAATRGPALVEAAKSAAPESALSVEHSKAWRLQKLLQGWLLPTSAH